MKTPERVRHASGFTLIELPVTIVVIGMALPRSIRLTSLADKATPRLN